VVRTETTPAGIEPVETQAPFTEPIGETAPSRKFAPAASITTLVRPRSRAVTAEKAG